MLKRCKVIFQKYEIRLHSVKYVFWTWVKIRVSLTGTHNNSLLGVSFIVLPLDVLQETIKYSSFLSDKKTRRCVLGDNLNYTVSQKKPDRYH